MEKIATNLLTGFLGSGKTSLLKRLLAAPDLTGTAVLVNEIGEVGLDHLLLEQVGEEVVLLASGCVCCTIRGDLKEAMLRLHGRMFKGELPPFDRLVIETTGLADPAPIVATLSADQVLRHHFDLGNIVTVVDAVDGTSNLDRFEEARRQVAVADRLVLSKTDLNPGAVEVLAPRLKALNPTATLHLSNDEDTPPSALLLEDILDPASKAGVVAQWLGGDAGHRAHHHEFDTCCLERDEPVDWVLFGLWLTMLLNRRGGDILRIKGLVDVAGVDSPLVVHGVQHTMHKPVHLDRWPQGTAGTRLVVIGRHLNPPRLQRSFTAFMGLSGADRAATAARESRPQTA